MLTLDQIVAREVGQELGLAVERESEHPTRTEHAAGALRGEWALAECVRQRRGARRALRETAQLQQAEVGIGCVGQPTEYDGQQLLHHTRVAGETGTQLAQRRARALDVGEPERAQPFLGGRGAQDACTRQRVEDRREEELLVQAAHHGLLRAVAPVELLQGRVAPAVAEPQYASEPGARIVGRGQRVCLLLVDQLEAVFHGSEPHVGLAELGGVGRVDVAAVGEVLERVERRRRADARVGATVHELQQLHRELDVADATATALDLAFVEPALVELGLAARLHRADLPNDVGPRHVGKDAPARFVEEARAEPVVARHRARLQQRLELPRVRPPVPVRGVRTERAARTRRSGLRV